MLRWRNRRCLARRCTIGAVIACAGVAGLAAGKAVAAPSLVPVPTTVTSIISVTSSIPKVTVPLPAPPPVTTAVPAPVPQVTTSSSPVPVTSAPKVTTTPADTVAATAGVGPAPPSSSAPGSPASGPPAGASPANAAPASNPAAQRRSVANRRPATIVVRLKRGGRVEFIVYGRAPECELLGRFVRNAKRGVNRFKFAGRVAGQVLEPGLYTMTLNRLRSTQRVRLARIGVVVGEQRVRVVPQRPLCAAARNDALRSAWVAPPVEGSRDVGSSSGGVAGAVSDPEAAGSPDKSGGPLTRVPDVLSAVDESVDLLSPFLVGLLLGLMALGLYGVAVAWSRFWRGSSRLF
jgi:hypothetical protein